MFAEVRLARDTKALMSRARARATRARLALVACALWVLGVEGLPALHQATHESLGAHHHAHGSIVTVTFEDTTHRHPDGTIHVGGHAADHAAGHVDGSPDASSRPRAAHRHQHDGEPTASSGTDHAGGLAHHAVGLVPPPPPITRPLPIDRRPSAHVVVQTVELVTRDPLSATARGPPSIA
jgi:hypothetical protein